MNELVELIVSSLRAMWRRRWIGLAAAWLIALVGTIVVLKVPERFEASARVYVDTQSLLRPLMEGLAIQPNLDQQVALMSRTLISRPNIEKLVRMADLDLAATTPKKRDDLIENVTRQLKLTPSGTMNLYVISYRDTEPEKARKTVQALLTIFVESSLGDKRADTKTAVKFLDDQIRQYEDNLKAAEGRVKDFRLKYIGMAGQSAGAPDYLDRMSRLGNEIESARMELRAAEQSRDSYKKELEGEAPVLLPDTNAAPSPAQPQGNVAAIDSRIMQLQGELASLSRRFNDSHPDIVYIKRQIADLDEMKQREVAARRQVATAGPGGGVSSPDRNPVYQQIKVSLADAEANVAALRARVGGLERQYAQLKESARMVPQIEAEYASLTRDYDIQKKTYETLLSRRQAAAMGEGVQDVGGSQFRVIDPPRVSPEPVQPSRRMLLAGVLLASLAGGLLAAFAASQIMPTFHDGRALRTATSRPVLGTVSMLQTETFLRARRRATVLFAGGVGALLVSFATMVLFSGLLSRLA